MNNVANNNFIDRLVENLQLKSDAELSRALEVLPPVISKIRHGRLEIGPTILLRAHEVSGVSIENLRAWGNIAPLLKGAA